MTASRDTAGYSALENRRQLAANVRAFESPPRRFDGLQNDSRAPSGIHRVQAHHLLVRDVRLEGHDRNSAPPEGAE